MGFPKARAAAARASITELTSRLQVLLLAVFFTIACSGGDQNAADTPQDPKGPAYTLEANTAEPPQPGDPTEWVLGIRNNEGKALSSVDVIHEYRFHVITVSHELDFFAHEHSSESGRDPLHVPITFARPGRYHVFVEFLPTGDALQRLRSEIVVPGEPGVLPFLAADDLSEPKQVGDYDVRLIQQGPHLTFQLTRDGTPVALEPYLGALGHAIVLSPEASDFVHTHPDSGSGADVGEVAFHVEFPRTGLYKIFAEFRPEGTYIMADFVLSVTAAPGGQGNDEH